MLVQFLSRLEMVVVVLKAALSRSETVAYLDIPRDLTKPQYANEHRSDLSWHAELH